MGMFSSDEQEYLSYSGVKHGKWETVKGVLTPGGDPLLVCGNCKSVDSEHLCGVEHPRVWNYCPVCGAKMDGDK